MWCVYEKACKNGAKERKRLPWTARAGKKACKAGTKVRLKLEATSDA